MSRDHQDFFTIRPDLSRPTTATSSSKLVIDSGRAKPTFTSVYGAPSIHDPEYSIVGASTPVSARTSPHPRSSHDPYHRQRPASIDNLRSRAVPASPLQRTWSSAKRRELGAITPEGIPIPRRRSSLASVTRHAQVISLTEAYRIALEEDEGAVATDGDESYDDLEGQQLPQYQSRGPSHRSSVYYDRSYVDRAPSRPLSPDPMNYTSPVPTSRTWDVSMDKHPNALRPTPSADQVGTIRGAPVAELKQKKSKSLIKSPSITRGLRRIGSKSSIGSFLSDDGHRNSPGGASKTSRLRKLVPGLSREPSNASNHSKHKEEKEKEKENIKDQVASPTASQVSSKRNFLKRLIKRSDKDAEVPESLSPSAPILNLQQNSQQQRQYHNHEHLQEPSVSPRAPISSGQDSRYQTVQATPPTSRPVTSFGHHLTHSQSYSGRSPSSRFSWHVDDDSSGLDLQTLDSSRVRVSPANGIPPPTPRRAKSTYEGQTGNASRLSVGGPIDRDRTLRISNTRLDEIRALEKAIEAQNGDGNEYLHHHVLTTTTTIIRPPEARNQDPDASFTSQTDRRPRGMERSSIRVASRSRTRDLDALSLRSPQRVISPDRFRSERDRRENRKSAPAGIQPLTELSEPEEEKRASNNKLNDIQAREQQLRRNVGSQQRLDEIAALNTQPRTRSLTTYNYRRRNLRPEGPYDDSMMGRVVSPVVSPRSDRWFWNDTPPTPPPKDTSPGGYRSHQAVTPEPPRHLYHDDSLMEDSFMREVREDSILEEEEPVEEEPSMLVQDASFLSVPEVHDDQRIRRPEMKQSPASAPVVASADVPLPSIERNPSASPEQPAPKPAKKSYAAESGTIRKAPPMPSVEDEESVVPIKQDAERAASLPTTAASVPPVSHSRSQSKSNIPISQSWTSNAPSGSTSQELKKPEEPAKEVPVPVKQQVSAPVVISAPAANVAPVVSEPATSTRKASRIFSPEPAAPHEALSSHPVAIPLVPEPEPAVQMKKEDVLVQSVEIEQPVQKPAQSEPQPQPQPVEPVAHKEVQSEPEKGVEPPTVSPTSVQLPMSPTIPQTTLAPIPGSPESPQLVEGKESQKAENERGTIVDESKIPNFLHPSADRSSSARNSVDFSGCHSGDFSRHNSTDLLRNPKRSASSNSFMSQRSASNNSSSHRAVERKVSTSTMHSTHSVHSATSRRPNTAATTASSINPISTVPPAKLAYSKRRSNASINAAAVSRDVIEVSDEDQLSDDSDIAEDSGRRRSTHRRHYPRPDKHAAAVAATEVMQTRAISPQPYDEDDMASLNESLNGDLRPIGPHVNVHSRTRSSPPRMDLKINPELASGVASAVSPTNSSPGLAPSPIPDSVPNVSNLGLLRMHRRAQSTDSSVRNRRLSRSPSGTELPVLADAASGAMRSVSGESFSSFGSCRSADSPVLAPAIIDGMPIETPRPPPISKVEPLSLSNRHSVGSFGRSVGRLDSIAEGNGNKVSRRASSMSLQGSRRASTERPAGMRAVSAASASSSESSRSRSQPYRRSAVINTAKQNSAHEDMRALKVRYGVEDSTMELTGEIQGINVVEIAISKASSRALEAEATERDIAACTKALMGIRSVRQDLGRLERVVGEVDDTTEAIESDEEDEEEHKENIAPKCEKETVKKVVIYQERPKAKETKEVKKSAEAPKNSQTLERELSISCAIIKAEPIKPSEILSSDDQDDDMSLYDLLEQEIAQEDALAVSKHDSDSDENKTLVPSTMTLGKLSMSRNWAETIEKESGTVRRRKPVGDRPSTAGSRSGVSAWDDPPTLVKKGKKTSTGTSEKETVAEGEKPEEKVEDKTDKKEEDQPQLVRKKSSTLSLRRRQSSASVDVLELEVPVPRMYSTAPFRLTVIGILVALIGIWYAAESAMCAAYCRPMTCSGPCVWSPQDPSEFGTAIPIKLDEWTTGGKGREMWNWGIMEGGDRVRDLLDWVTGTDIEMVDGRELSFEGRRSLRRRLRRKGKKGKRSVGEAVVSGKA